MVGQATRGRLTLSAGRRRFQALRARSASAMTLTPAPPRPLRSSRRSVRAAGRGLRQRTAPAGESREGSDGRVAGIPPPAPIREGGEAASALHPTSDRSRRRLPNGTTTSSRLLEAVAARASAGSLPVRAQSSSPPQVARGSPPRTRRHRSPATSAGESLPHAACTAKSRLRHRHVTPQRRRQRARTAPRSRRLGEGTCSDRRYMSAAGARRAGRRAHDLFALAACSTSSPRPPRLRPRDRHRTDGHPARGAPGSAVVERRRQLDATDPRAPRSRPTDSLPRRSSRCRSTRDRRRARRPPAARRAHRAGSL